ncbi:MAG: type VI secretion system membrane subunit TssM [Chromatiaceae bacterium]|nr:type VI secretion system membrane subunit TssM [Chromatiaceae bacterium]
MRRFFRIFRNRWVISALGLIAIALVIWLLGPFVAIADYRLLESVIARVIATLIVLVIWLLILLIRQLRAKSADKQLIEGMAEAEEAVPSPASATGIEAAEEKEELKRRFEEAVEVLRQPKEKGQRKATSLYELPWYIIFGPPGCGKTTALANSGIDFPLAERFGQEVLSGIGGTRNCDWWISNEAVLIDTAGRYTTQDSEAAVDSAAWLGFLDLLKKYRRRRPINGAIVAFSIADLIMLDDGALAVHCRAIRKRLQELSERIGISIPVYLVFTKADLLAGFLQFFDDLGREERQQVWGTTFPLLKERPDYADLFDGEMQALLQRLNERINWRLISERDLHRRVLILGFPQQLASLRENLRRFLRDIFQGSRFEKPIMLRGVYFSSGTQEGTPIDRLMGSMAESFGLQREAATPPGGRGKSYFITNLLRKVIFRERNLAGSDRKAERLRAWAQRGAYAAVVLATALAVLAWAASFTENKAFTADLEARLRQYEELREAKISSALSYEEILPRLDALRGMLDHVEEVTSSPPLSMRLGLYQGDGIAKATQDAYTRALNALLVPGLATQLEAQLATSFEDPSYSYETLKLYLMLVDPARLQAEPLQFWAADDWARRFPEQSQVQSRLKIHLAYLLEQGVEPIEPNRRLVRQVRDELEQHPLAELVYGRLKITAAVREAAPLTFEDIAGHDADGVFDIAAADPSSLQIPALFTYRGFFQLFQPQSLELISELKGESWVYGPEESPIIAGQLQEIEESVLDLYIDEYIRRWDNLLGQLSIRSFATISDAIDVTGRLIRPDSPLKKVLDTLESNTDLTRLPKGTESLAKIAVEQLRRKNYYLARIMGEASRGGFDDAVDFPPKRVVKHFAVLTRLVDSSSDSGQIAQIQRMITDLYSQLSALEPESGFSENPFSSSAASSQDVFHTLRTEAARAPEPVRRWLRQIAANAQAVALGDAGERINEIYKSSVAPVCNKLIKDRYPFSSGSRREINVYDFGKLFGDGGLLDTFFAEHLAPYVDTAPTPWHWRKSAKKNLGVSDASLMQFQRAQVIKQAFFPDGGKLPNVRFSLIPRRIDPLASLFTLTFGGQIFSFDAFKPSPVDGEWPGRNISSRATMTVVDLDGEQYEQDRAGQWAFFRMVNPPRLSPGSDRFRTAFSVQGFRHTFEIQAFSAINPFGLSDIKKFRCVDSL